MAYVPKDWVTGEVITEQALDHIEQGIAGLIMVTHEVSEGMESPTTLDKTWQEIHDHIAGDGIVLAMGSADGGAAHYSLLLAAYIDQGQYKIESGSDPYNFGSQTYIAETANSYPARQS